MKKPTLAEIENAFQPSREIDDAARFAGRKTAVSDSHYALLSSGSNIAVIGNRGIGKTSLARQIIKLASGDSRLLKKLEIQQDKEYDFLTTYLACGKMVANVEDLLSRLLTTSGCLRDWIYDVPSATKEVKTYSPEISARIFGIGAKLGGSKTTETESTPALSTHSIDVVFANVCQAIAEQRVAADGILLVIDEFDQIGDPAGMAGLMKSLATNVPNVKFCIVGVAKDLQLLMEEHESIDRLFAGGVVNLPPMSDEDLSEIVRIAETSIGGYIRFSDSATNRLVRLAQGHPYMIHLVGKYALRAAHQGAANIIEEDAIDSALRSIAERNADPVLDGRYMKAVGSSPQRETVLRSLAGVRSADGECWTKDAYRDALDAGVDNASQYVGQLVTDEYGAEIERVRDRYYRFRDSLFAAYTLARPRRYEETTD